MGASESRGKKWTGKISLDPNSDGSSTVIHVIDKIQLRDGIENIIDDRELIENIWVYNCPISSWEQHSQVYLNHQFVVLETSYWWWSIEKNDEEIAIQRSKELAYVFDYFRRNKRPLPISQMSYDNGRGMIADLFNFLYNNEELEKVYSLTNENCQHFARRIFDEVAQSKTHSTINIYARETSQAQMNHRKEDQTSIVGILVIMLIFACVVKSIGPEYSSACL